MMSSWRAAFLKKVALVVSIYLTWLLLTGLLMHKELTDFNPKARPFRTATMKPDMNLTLQEDAREENGKRLKRIKEVCKKYNLGQYQENAREEQIFKYPPSPQYSVFYYDLYDNLSVCPVYKAGSTSWLYNLCLLGGETESTLRNNKEQLSTIARRLYPELEYDQAIVVLPNTKKLMTVRHPFDRILSAYRDKLENVNIGWEHGTRHFYRKYGAKIVKKYRRNEKKAVLKTGTYFRNPLLPNPSGYEPTFEEFVKYLIDVDLLNYSDDHWIPYNLFCTPCHVDYDYVNKVETMDRDQTFVIEDLGVEDKIKASWRHKSSPNVVSQEYLIRSYFSQLTRRQIQDLFTKYKLDFEMFDYTPDKYFSYAKH